ncbi:MAG: flagellar basal-body MS-ring/collar protein FliF, partial [Thermodesulfobacteriota bacterium]|nr:flagellar basal-body MS-ring/collar protein FliF [Thermodesulfobacteriota bacterium]
QELNYRRALQGELARTINQFREVDSSKVFIVLPKESLFIEDSKPASASIQLNLKSGLPANKLGAIVHLVANAVEGLEPEHVTVVDTRGRVIFKGGNRDDDSALLSDGQLDYKVKVEQEIRKNVQTMLEGIVGAGRAIVRVNASIDFNRITANEEEYDPSTTAVRSKRNIEESTEMGGKGVQRPQTLINKRSGVVPSSAGNQNRKIKKDIATNYEINKIIRTVLKPAGTIKRLSVAAVIDGTYKYEKLKDETIKKTYIPRSEEELKTFEVMVKRAMGFSEDREDQVSVNSLPFSNAMPLNTVSGEGEAFDPLKFVGNYKKAIINLFFIIMAFFFIVKPLMKSLKNVGRDTVTETKELPSAEEYPRIPEPEQMNQREKVLEISKHSPEKTQQFIKGWLNEQE